MKKHIGIYALVLLTGMTLLLVGLYSSKSLLSGILVASGVIVLGLSATKAAPLFARKEADKEGDKIEWYDERNIAIREKAAWYAGMILIAAMSVSSFVLVMANQLAGACVIAGLLLLYSISIIVLSAYFSKKL